LAVIFSARISHKKHLPLLEGRSGKPDACSWPIAVTRCAEVLRILVAISLPPKRPTARLAYSVRSCPSKRFCGVRKPAGAVMSTRKTGSPPDLGRGPLRAGPKATDVIRQIPFWTGKSPFPFEVTCRFDPNSRSSNLDRRSALSRVPNFPASRRPLRSSGLIRSRARRLVLRGPSHGGGSG
jgi:hypothetical protein